MTTIDQTVNEIASGMAQQKSKSPMDSVNPVMWAVLVSALDSADSVINLKVRIMKGTGLRKAGFDECKACQYILAQFKKRKGIK